MSAKNHPPGWIRPSVPEELRVTFVVKRSEDRVLHAYIGSLPFGQASKEIRRLINIGLQSMTAQSIGAQPVVLEKVLPEIIEKPVPVKEPMASTDIGATPVQEGGYPQDLGGEKVAAVSGEMVGGLTADQLSAISLLDSMLD